MSDSICATTRAIARALLIVALVSIFFASTKAGAQTFSIAPGSPTVPAAGPGCGPFSATGDVLVAGAPPVAFVPLGPPGCGLGWFGPPVPANLDAFSSGVTPMPPPPIPPAPAPGTFLFSVDGGATGYAGPPPCGPPPPPVAPGPFPPSVSSESGGQPAFSDAAADVFMNAVPFAGPLPGFFAAPNTQVFDGNGLAAPPFGIAPGPPLGLAEPVPGGDNLDAFDSAAIGAWSTPLGIPAVPVYFSVDAPTSAAVGGVPAPSDVVVSVGGFLAGIYAAAPALGLGAGDDLDALALFDTDGAPLGFAPGVDVIYFSVAPGSAIIGAPNPCPGPFFGALISEGDILTEGTTLGVPGAACIVALAVNNSLWDFFFCGPNPLTGAAASDNLDALDVVLVTTTTTITTTTTTTVTTTTGPTTTSSTVTTTTSTTTTTLSPLCGPTPLPDGSCKLADPGTGAGKSSVQIKDDVSSTKDSFKWKWNKGALTVVGDFKNPDLSGATYRVCIYDGSGGSQPLLEADIPNGGLVPTCGTKPCWKQSGSTGFKYKNKAGTPDGITGVKFKAGAAGKASVGVKGKGSLLGPPAPGALVTDVIVQLLIDDGFTTTCFKTAVPGGSGSGSSTVIVKPTSATFKGKGP